MQISHLRFLAPVVVALLFLIPTKDTDLGWHLRYGEYFLTYGRPLYENALTYFLADYAWAHPYTGYQILTTLIYKAGGLLLLSALLGLVLATTYVVFDKINPRIPKANLIAFLAIAWSGWHVFHLGWRSQIFTFVGLVLTFYLLKKLLEQPKRLLVYLSLYLFLFATWVNLHGGFVAGLAVLGLATIDSAVRRDWTKTKILATATIVSAAATLINPYGTKLYNWPLIHAQVPLENLIAEWVPPKIPVRLAILAVALLLAILAIKRTRNKIFWPANLAFFTVLALDAGRAIPLFALVAALAILESLNKELANLESPKFEKGASLFVVCAAAVLLATQVPNTTDFDTNWKSYCTKGLVVLPCRAVEYIRAKPPVGQNVYSAYEWGGFLEWQLPQYKYFVDGRMPAWATPEKKSPYTIYLEIIQAKPDWEERLNTYGTDWLLIGNGTFLDIELTNRQERSWQEIYRDNVAVIYKK